MNGEAGKGSVYRRVDWQRYSQNYDRVFPGVNAGVRAASKNAGVVNEPTTEPGPASSEIRPERITRN